MRHPFHTQNLSRVSLLGPEVPESARIRRHPQVSMAERSCRRIVVSLVRILRCAVTGPELSPPAATQLAWSPRSGAGAREPGHRRAARPGRWCSADRDEL